MKNKLLAYCVLVIFSVLILAKILRVRESQTKERRKIDQALQSGVQPIETLEIEAKEFTGNAIHPTITVEEQGQKRWTVTTSQGEIDLFNPGDIQILRIGVWESAFSKAKMGGQQLDPALYSILDNEFYKVTSGNSVAFFIRSRSNQRFRGRIWYDAVSQNRAISFDTKNYNSSDPEKIMKVLKATMNSGKVFF